MLKEFKDFAMRGNVLELAVGFILATAFGKIVTSLVNDIIMPPIGLLFGEVDFTNLYINLSGKQYTSLQDAQAAGAATINYGLFINTIVDFIIVAFVLFLVVRQYNRTKKKEEKPAEPTTKDWPYCYTSIPIKAIRCPNCTTQLEALNFDF